MIEILLLFILRNQPEQVPSYNKKASEKLAFPDPPYELTRFAVFVAYCQFPTAPLAPRRQNRSAIAICHAGQKAMFATARYTLGLPGSFNH